MEPALSSPDDPRISQTPRWSAAATEALIEGWNSGEAPADLAQRLGVSISALYARVRGLRRRGVVLEARRLPTVNAAHPPTRTSARARRTCLTCSQKFRSTHIGNRIREPCLLLSGLF